jgi:DNA repair exonuclease SbcCD nuclease subunit
MINNNICIISDTHFGFENNSEQVLESSLKFFYDVLIPFLNKNKINNIFILGDIFDSRVSVNTKIQNEIYKLFDENLNNFNLYILIGNHDIYYNSTTEIHSLKFLKKFKNVTLIETPQIIKINNKEILMVPWIINNDTISNIVLENNAEILMGHFDIKGFNLNKFSISKHGINPDLFVNKFKIIFSGHFHTRSIRKIGNSEFIYIGTPYQLTRADMDEERGFLIYNLKSEKYKFFSNDVSTKFTSLEYPNSFSKKIIFNNRVDLTITYDKNSYKPNEYNKYINEIEKYKPIKITPIYVDTTNLNSNLDITKCNISSISDLFKEYVNSMNISEYEKEEIIKILIDVYNKFKGND